MPQTLLGASKDNFTGTVVFNPTAQDTLGAHRSISLYILIVTIGRREALRLLDSMAPQLQPQDYTVVIFNNQDRHGVFDQVNAHYTCTHTQQAEGCIVNDELCLATPWRLTSLPCLYRRRVARWNVLLHENC